MTKKSICITLVYPDSEGQPVFVLSGNAESALLSNTAHPEDICSLNENLKMSIDQLNFPPTGRRQSIPQPDEEDRIILVESFAGRGC